MEGSRNFVISTDTSCDLPFSFYDENEVNLLSLGYVIDGETFYGDDRSVDVHGFYEKMRAGKMPTTMQVNPEQAEQSFEVLAKKGVDVLHLAFSSGLSGTYGSTLAGAQAVLERHPTMRIVVIDTLAASLGQGLLVHYAVKLKNEGRPLDEVAAWIEEQKHHLAHYITVEDLNHLHRGGRLSKAAAVMGTMLGIKPLLYVDDEGKLITMGKVRGRRQSLNELIERMGPKMEGCETNAVFISHGDCIEDAQYCADEIKKRYHIKNFLLNSMGAVIGTHAGPGAIVLCFVGKDKKE